jgi:hypothetical protein
VVGDLAVLRAINARLVEAALDAVDDLAFGRQVGELPVIEVLAIGERADHIVYRDTLARLAPASDDTADDVDDPASEKPRRY